ncbi:MAG TPA: SAM-dependent methyltransferase [Streptosporangiaceae bacterium]
MPDFDTSVPHIARVYDYWLGGKDNFAADREMGERTLAAYPNLVYSVRANRAFLARTVRFLAGEVGIRQFLDIGTGIPTANNTHEVAQRIAPESRIVYVDNDPVVLSHAKALLKSTPEGACAYLYADLRDPDKILAGAADTLDFSQPVAVMLIAVMHFVGDDAQASAIVNRLMGACVPGSYLAMSHAASDIDAAQMAEMVRRLNESTAEKTTLRDRAGVARLFDGLDLVEPGLIRAAEWRPATELEASSPAALWGGVGRKP